MKASGQSLHSEKTACQNSQRLLRYRTNQFTGKIVTKEQSRPRGGQSGGVEDQPQCRGLWHSSSPRSRSLSHSPSPPPPSFTQSPSPPRSPVRDGQPSPHRPRLVVSRSTCPPLSPSPHANSFIIGTAVINSHQASFEFCLRHFSQQLLQVES
jgi:hypothetical protein